MQMSYTGPGQRRSRCAIRDLRSRRSPPLHSRVSPLLFREMLADQELRKYLFPYNSFFLRFRVLRRSCGISAASYETDDLYDLAVPGSPYRRTGSWVQLTVTIPRRSASANIPFHRDTPPVFFRPLPAQFFRLSPPYRAPFFFACAFLK